MTTDVHVSTQSFYFSDQFNHSFSKSSASKSSVKRRYSSDEGYPNWVKDAVGYNDISAKKRRRVCHMDSETFENDDPQDFKIPCKVLSTVNKTVTPFNDHISAPAVIQQPVPDVPSDSEQSRVISIQETYQLGYFDVNQEPEELFIFDFVDGLEVSYPITVTATDTLPFDLPPLFLEPEYVDELTSLATNALNQLTDRLNSWLIACEEADQELFIWRHVTAFKESVELRKLIFELLTILVPQYDSFKTKVDFSSPKTDRIFAQITSALSVNPSGSMFNSDFRHSVDAVPVVSLCSEPTHCLDSLRSEIFELLRALLPQLDLPSSFDAARDLRALLSMVCAVNKEYS